MNNEEILKTQGASGVIVSACSLWAHIAIISAIIFVVSIVKTIMLSKGLYSTISLILFLLTQFICLRLNLDSKLFKVLETCDEISAFDAGIKFLFNKDKSNSTMEERWIGTKKLLRKAFFYLIIQLINAIFIFLY